MQSSVFGQKFLKDANAELKVYWPLPENELSSLESQTLRQLNGATDCFGKMIGSSFIAKEKVADFFVRKIYVIRYEK
ncbi:MAG: hypothetical protein PF481_08240 [Bacteroidales bacterium]|jgi:hypothetical protein|nr:hypothetical protein [Bacteroidales bacterium]